jgi:hypothetical protein
MHAPRESLLFLVLMTAVCLLAGLVFGIGTGLFVRPPQATATPTVAPSATNAPSPAVVVSVTPGQQKSLLLIGVADASTPDAALEACWVISFRAGVPEYYVTAFPPSASLDVEGLDGPHPLSQIHAEDMRLQIAHNFVRDAVQTRFPAFAIEADVMLDRGDLSALVGQLGGVPLNNQTLSGPMLLQTYDAWPAANDVERVAFQGDILNRLFGLLGERQWTALDLVSFLAQMPHVSADPARVAALQAFAQDAPPVAGASLIWRVFTPDMEASSRP